MTFSTEWEQLYKSNTHLSVWPWSDVVSLTNRYAKTIIQNKGSVFELGCGAGANIPFFNALGMEYFAIDGSQTIIEQLHTRYPVLKNKITCIDFKNCNFFNKNFDLIIDRASLVHNNLDTIITVLDKSLKSLNEDGFFIAVDWFSTKHADIQFADNIDDKYTYYNFKQGHLAGCGKVHFFDEEHLKEVFKDFEILLLEEKVIKQSLPNNGHQFAAWNIVAKKK
ncbi:class I SAM-dependent methyltransferase [Acinetobacter sp. ANC 4216]|uniref:class I SAM-dependent methyltransferase n=1 Tax=Acinetobacter sp. ANC 4216 TaxID=2529840 RepID=UPI0013F16697|nr:class I SAM-dependent methyltransferase [Acinetobacter sp. ANC 4216]